MARVVRAGDDIRKGVTASWFNEQNKKRTQAKSNGLVHIPENPIKVDCVANAGLTFSRFQAANIVGPAIPYEDFDGDAVQYSTSRVKVNSTLIVDKWGKAIILSPPESPGLPGLILIRGGINIESPFFVLTGNMTPVAGSWATARAMADFCDWDNNVLFSDYLYSWLGIIDDEQTGFKGTAEYFKGRWRFEQGPCDQGEG